MTADKTSPSPPSSKQRGIKIRKFVKRVASFASRSSTTKNNSSEQHSRSASQPNSTPEQPAATDASRPPLQQNSFSTSSSATATSNSQQPTILAPREDDQRSVHSGSGELSDSQESSFSGLSALPSDYGQSLTSSPARARSALRESSLCVSLASSFISDLTFI